MTEPISVSELNNYIKERLESDSRLRLLLVEGEISNLTDRTNLYFSLKDSSASVRCVMFRGYRAHMDFSAKNGMYVFVLGTVSAYPRDGIYQIYVQRLIAAGAGTSALSLEHLKEKLEKEGLFDPSHKKPLPSFPMNIGVITSPDSAALRDILSVVSRRFPISKIVVYPTTVQGADAPRSIVEQFMIANRQRSCDLLILARGGGSLEDLAPFNSEIVARAIYISTLPVISGVGHETDYTLADFVADVRAPTPSAAAELAVPNKDELLSHIMRLEVRLKNGYANSINSKLSRVDSLKAELNFDYSLKLKDYSSNVCTLLERATAAFRPKLDSYQRTLERTISALEAANPLLTLKRGYGIISSDGNTISSINDVKAENIIQVQLKDGVFTAKILDIQ